MPEKYGTNPSVMHLDSLVIVDNVSHEMLSDA